MSETEFGLKRSLGLGALIVIEVGLIIGAGIFVLVGVAMKETGPSVPIAFLAAAVPIMLVMLSLAMISSAIPCAGGTYRYASRLVSPAWAWLGAWGYLLGMVFGAFPLYSLRAIEYLFQAFPGFNYTELQVQLGASLLLTALYLFNYRGVSLAASVQAIMVLVLLSAMIYFITAGMGKVNPANFHPLFPKGAGGLLLGSAILTLALLGANGVIELGAEIKKPGTNIPVSMAVSVLLVTFLYVLIGVVAVGVIPHGDLKNILLTEQAKMVLSPLGMRFFFIGGAFLAITTSINGLFICVTKSMLVVSDDRLLPGWFYRVHPKFNTPHRFLTAVWLIGILSIFFPVPTGTFESYASIGGLIIFIPLMLAVIRFPKKLPQAYDQAPFKLKGIFLYLCPALGMLLSLFAILLLFTQELKPFWRYFFIGFLMLGALLYIWQTRTIHTREHLQKNIERDLKNWSTKKQ